MAIRNQRLIEVLFWFPHLCKISELGHLERMQTCMHCAVSYEKDFL
jgi:hypothetical protein